MCDIDGQRQSDDSEQPVQHGVILPTAQVRLTLTSNYFNLIKGKLLLFYFSAVLEVELEIQNPVPANSIAPLQPTSGLYPVPDCGTVCFTCAAVSSTLLFTLAFLERVRSFNFFFFLNDEQLCCAKRNFELDVLGLKIT